MDRAELAIDVQGLTKSFVGGRVVVDDFAIDVPRGPHLRLSRAQRQRQDHDHPHALRPADARRRQRHAASASTSSRESAADQARGRLHDAALQPLRGPLASARTSTSSRASTTCREREAAVDADARAARPRPSAQRQLAGAALGRLEAAPRARRLPAARARSCCCSTSPPPASTPRRGATSGTRSTPRRARASPCWSAPTTWTRPSAATARLSSPTASCWRTARSQRGGRASRASSPSTVAGAGSAKRSRPQLRGQPGVEMVAPFGAALHVSGTDRGAARAEPSRPCAPIRGTRVERRPQPSLEDVFIQTLPARPRVTLS